MNRLTLPIFLLLLSANISAQIDGQLYRSDAGYLSGVKVTADGKEKTLAWAGGLNNPQFGMVDLDHDGRKDVVIYERTNIYYPFYGVKTFLNYGTSGNPYFLYAPEYEFRFPYPYKWMKLLDYNCDNIPDYFYGTFAQYVCDGYYDSGNNWAVKNCREIKYPVGSGTSNIPILSEDIPGLEDLNSDGDLDWVCFTQVGFMEEYRSMRSESSDPCDSLKIRYKDRCWGKAKQYSPREHILGLSCDNSGLKMTKTTDGVNGICLFDNDGDEDMDVLVGNALYTDIQFLKNGRKEHNYPLDTITAQDTTWQSGGKKLYMPSYPMAYWVDINDDNKRDIVISPLVSGENYHCVAYYKNTGTTTSPVYTYQDDSFIVDEMIDLGSNSYPMLYDYDKDGDKDLFVGAKGFYQSGGIYRTALFYFRNTTSGNNISFDLADRNFLKIDTMAAPGAALAAGDLDNDGLDDLVAGRIDGTITWYRNDAAGAGVQPVWKMQQAQLKDSAGNAINISNYAAPFIYDIDKDGKNDLLIGNQTGYISYYKNIGTPGQLKLAFRTNKLGDVKVVPGMSYGFSAPFIGLVDNSGTEYLMVGSEEGVIYRYTGFQGGNVTAPYTKMDSVYSELKLPGKYLAPVFADLNGDNKFETIIGNEKGGLFLYRQLWNVGIPEIVMTDKLKIYPNPAQNELRIVHALGFPAGAKLSIYDNMGRLVLDICPIVTAHEVTVDISSLHSGIYRCALYMDGTVISASFVKQ